MCNKWIMKILVTINYRKQRATPRHLFCLSKTTVTQLRVQVDQTGGPSDILVNRSQFDEVLKVDRINVCCTFVHKHRRVNQEQHVTSQCASLMVVNLQIITFDIHNPLQMVFILHFWKFKSCMSTSCVSCMLWGLSLAIPQMGDHHLNCFLSTDPSMD